MPGAFERGDAVGFALIGDVDVDLCGRMSTWPASARMIFIATPRSASIVQTVCRSAWIGKAPAVRCR